MAQQRMSRRIGGVAAAIVLGAIALAGPLAGTAGAGAERNPSSRPAASGTWHSSTAPVPKMALDPYETVDSVDCLPTGGCVALADARNASDRLVLAALTTSGGHWTSTSLPMPSGKSFSGVVSLGISCTALSSCVAAVQLNAETVAFYTESSGSWSVAVAPLPSGAPKGAYQELVQLSCAASDVCSVTGEWAHQVVVVTDDAGSLSSVFIPVPEIKTGEAAKYTYAGGISCPAPGDCVVVGLAERGSVGDAFASVESSGTWQTELVPAAVAGSEEELTAVACTGVGSCTAVGDEASSVLSDSPVIATLAAGVWTVSPLTLPAPLSSSLTALTTIECSDASDCLATGDAVDVSNFTESSFIASESASTWTAEATPLPSGTTSKTQNVIEGSSCASAGDCDVVGLYETAGGGTGAMVDRESSGTWTSETLGLSSLAVSRVDATAAFTRLSAELARTHFGPVLDSARPEHAARGAFAPAKLAGRSAPRAIRTLLDARASHGASGVILGLEFTGLSCGTAGDCTAVGSYINAAVDSEGMTVSITPTEADPARAVVPAGAGVADHVAEIEGVACPSEGHCFAVGSVYNRLEGVSSGLLIDTERGGRWKPSSPSLPDGGIGLEAIYTAIACGGPHSCTAVGSSAYGPIASIWKSGRWSTQFLKPPASDPKPEEYGLSGVTCSAPSSCLAFGYITVGQESEEGLLDPESAGHFTPVVVGASKDSLKHPEMGLRSAACQASGRCVATGYYVERGYREAGLVVSGTGTSWTSARVPLPKGTSKGQSVATSVSCTATSCVPLAEYLTGPDNISVRVLEQHGSKWVARAVPLPSGGVVRDTELGSISCGATACTAVGSYFDAQGVDEPMILTGSGSQWSAVKGPSPAGSHAHSLTDVACNARNRCTAIGLIASIPYVASGRGTSFTAASVPLPTATAKHPETEIAGIVCPNQKRCVAAVSYRSKSGGRSALDSES